MPPSHIGHALSRIAVERACLPISISNGDVKTGRQLVERIQCLSTGLRELGLQCGDRVAIMALNSDQYLEWLIAVPCAGGIIAPLNYRWSSKEACEAVLQVEPILLVIDHHCAKLGAEIRRQFPTLQTITLGFSISGALDADLVCHGSGEFGLFWAPDNIALICFTSGTSGKPKGAAISHNAIIFQSLAKIAMVKYSKADVYLHTSPLCHIGAISSAHAITLAGGFHVFLPKFHAQEVLDAIEKYKVTAMITVPTMLKDLTLQLLSRGFNNAGMGSVRMILNGAESLSLDLLRQTTRSFPAARILTSYGMTEACSSMSFITLHDPAFNKVTKSLELNHVRRELHSSHLGGICVGRPAPHVEVMLTSISDATATRGCLHEEGHVLVRGPHMMERYWGETQDPFDKCGWFQTGDVGWMDHMGQVWLLGRTKDIIKTGGENVYCYEVEDILARHPAIATVAVAGVHDARLGEVVGAMVRLRDEWKWKDDGIPGIEQVTYFNDDEACSNKTISENLVSPSSMQLFCRQQGLSRYKVPKTWCQKFGDFAMTSTGKVRKDVVRRELAAHREGLLEQHVEEPVMSKL